MDAKRVNTTTPLSTLFPSQQKATVVQSALKERNITLKSDHRGGAVAVKTPIAFSRQAF